MKVTCEACGIECEVKVQGPTLLRRALPKGWRPRCIDGKTFVLCDVCGNLRQFVGGLSPYLSARLNLPSNVSIEFPEYTEMPDAWLNRTGPARQKSQRKNASKGDDMTTDINKLIASGGEDPERQAREAEVADWNRDVATRDARMQNLELTDEHVAVIRYLQADYVEHGSIRHARELADMLDKHFAERGGRKYLYELFPGGPVYQGGRLAGIPVPADAKDSSFGSVL